MDETPNPYQSPKFPCDPTEDEREKPPRPTWVDVAFVIFGVAALAVFVVNVIMKIA
jgi:hypothetical protein